ncbi:hypothetical protein CspeluHIS016_0803450 [Cutaneotrichosporon spelunceum]|uniref:Xylanolytic transcriptional activator regulatory domain-containing protein n=1 Tax=Cutaneotrichosporon spelunceum TaxID=1672016 RepID=A0AAD3YF54_9TREE|nr:hypothetical protein CspeluHIS016_0803450 [Cutaneotrichosporon spelunceum]
MPTFVRAPAPRRCDFSLGNAVPGPSSHGENTAYRKRPASDMQWGETQSGRSMVQDKDTGSSDDEDEGQGDDALVSSNLQNPSDALRLLANASSLPYHSLHSTYPAKARDAGMAGNSASAWSTYGPIQQGLVTVQDARALFSFFELEMAPLYPLIHPMLFQPHYLDTLVRDEPLLLGAILTIAARYSNVLADNRGAVLHKRLCQWVRLQFMLVMDGESTLRSISTVEALLLLSEWPMLPMSHQLEGNDEPETEEFLLLKPSLRYDAYSWGNIGWAVRLAQELGIHDIATGKSQQIMEPWKTERMLKTWVYCYNADRHISVRLGRNAVLQQSMTSRWWEDLSDHVNRKHREGSNDVWASDLFILACIAQLMGTVQDYLYIHKDVTRSLLRTGAWERFLQRLRLEIGYSKEACQAKLNDGTVDSALLRIEFDYLVLYAYSLTLRGLQGKLRRRRQVNDVHYHSPSLLNMIEGPWIMEALHAARSIIDIALNVLEKRGILRVCPSRIFQYILFAATFMYKALATGMVEHGQQSTVSQLDKAVRALSRASIDDQHFLRGFAGLLTRLGKHWRTVPRSNSRSVLNPAHASISLSEARLPEAPLPEAPLSEARLPEAPLSEAPLSEARSAAVPVESLLTTVPENAFGIAPSPSPAPLAISQDLAMSQDFTWNFDPMFQMPAADHEQDMLFESIWQGAEDASGSASNLYATLLGDALAFPEGLDGL